MLSPDEELKYMQAALELARQAGRQDEVPVGAIVVYQGRIIGRGFNQRETKQNATAHAEISAIQEACTRLNSWRLNDCTIFVTLEPCVMCAGAIIQARLQTLIFATSDPKTGACGSVLDVLSYPFNHRVQVKKGLLAEESAALLRDFFRQRRNNLND